MPITETVYRINRYLRIPKTYYVAAAGNDNNSGSYQSPLQTYAAVVALKLLAGDRVLFNRGDTFACGAVGVLPVYGGVPGRNVFFGDYGSGAKPKFTATATVWDLGTTPYITLKNLWATGAGNYGFNSTGHDVTFINCDSDGANTLNGFHATSGLTVGYNYFYYGCTCTNAKTSGFEFSSVLGSYGIVVDSCISHGNGTSTSTDHGFYFKYTNGAILRRCVSYSNKAGGVKFNADASQICGNSFYGNQDGILSDGDVNNVGRHNLIFNNLSYNNSDDGLVLLQDYSSNDYYYHNDFVNNTNYGMQIQNNKVPTGNVFKNNLFHQLNSLPCGRCYRINAAVDAANNTWDKNLYYDNGGDNKISQYNPLTAYTWTQWKALTGTPDVNSINATSPIFVTNYTDLHLQANSPCKGAGATGLGVLNDFDSVVRASPPSMGAYE